MSVMSLGGFLSSSSFLPLQTHKPKDRRPQMRNARPQVPGLELVRTSRADGNEGTRSRGDKQ